KSTWLERLQRAVFGKWARRRHLDQMRQLVDATQLAPPAADAEMQRIVSHNLSLRLAGMEDGSQKSWVPLIRRLRTTLAYLVRLRSIIELQHYRAVHGRWPMNWQEVGGIQPIDPRTGVAFALRPGLEALVLAPLPDGPRTEEDLAIELR